MKLTLVVGTPGPNQGKVIPIQSPQLVIGRHAQCHLRPANALVSNRHCALIRRQDRGFVRDLGSTNGTFVNKQQVNREIELRDGDRLRVGPLIFVVRLESAAAVNRPTPLPPTKEATHKLVTHARPPAADKGPETPVDEEEAVALLLSLPDGDGRAFGSGGGVPEGSMEHELASAGQAAGQDKQKERPKSAGMPPPPPRRSSRSTSSAPATPEGGAPLPTGGRKAGLFLHIGGKPARSLTTIDLRGETQTE